MSFLQYLLLWNIHQNSWSFWWMYGAQSTLCVRHNLFLIKKLLRNSDPSNQGWGKILWTLATLNLADGFLGVVEVIPQWNAIFTSFFFLSLEAERFAWKSYGVQPLITHHVRIWVFMCSLGWISDIKWMFVFSECASSVCSVGWVSDIAYVISVITNDLYFRNRNKTFLLIWYKKGKYKIE